MKQVFMFLFTFWSIASFAQRKSNSDKTIYSTIDKNAEIMLKKSKANSVSIGIIKNSKTYTKHFGELDKGKGNKANKNTHFEIASVTKIFTGTLMAKAVLEGKINLEDDIRKYLNGSYPNLEYQTIPVTIKDLISYQTAFDRELPNNSKIRKTENDSTVFDLRKLDEKYDKKQFFEDLKTVKLDTIPGKIFTYSNLSLELSAFILENVYHKSYETLFSENILSQLKMNATKLNSKENNTIANGYNSNQVVMPTGFTNLWGAGAYRNSTMEDLMKFMSFQLDTKNKLAQETQRNISNSDQYWNGYFWDGILVVDNGIFCHKHGGGYGTQTFFAVYPEQQLGIVVIINQSTRDTHGNLFNAVLEIAEDLKTESHTKKVNYGYRLTNDKVIYTYKHPKNLDAKFIKSISVVGSFNEWNTDNKLYQMIPKGKNTFKLTIPKSTFEKGKTYLFKFVINKVGWTMTPKNALNTDKTEDNNLMFKID